MSPGPRNRQVRPERLELRLEAAIEKLITVLRTSAQPESMSLTTAATLRTLVEEGSYRLTELAELSGVTQPGMTQLVQRLERAGVVERRSDPADGRVAMICATPAGREAVARLRSKRTEQLRVLLQGISEEDHRLIDAAIPAMTRLSTSTQDNPMNSQADA
jgi:DNA-binding MarR family transcriptional regulator